MSQNDNPYKKDNGFSWDSLPHIVSLITVLAYIALGIFVAVQWKYFSGWLMTLKDLEVSKDSVKIERFDSVQSGYLPPVPDFASDSPLGSGGWFVPWRLRWNVPDGRSLV